MLGLPEGPIPGRAEARVVKRGRQVVTVEADVLDDAGKLLAQAGAFFMVLR